jgi:hypothetical protein
VRTREGLLALIEELGQISGHKSTPVRSHRISKGAFAQALRSPEAAKRVPLPASAWVTKLDGSPVLTGPKNRPTSFSRSLVAFANFVKQAYAGARLERFVPWASTTAQERVGLVEGPKWLYDVVARAARGEALTDSEIATAAEEYDKTMRAGEAAAFFLKDVYSALSKVAPSAGRGDAYNYEAVRSAAYSAVSSARVRSSRTAGERWGASHENNAGIALAHLGSLVKESSRSTGLGSKPLVMNQRQMAYFNVAAAAEAAGILRKGSGTGVAMIDLQAKAFGGSLSIVRPDGSIDGYGKATPLRASGAEQAAREFHEGPDDQTPQMQYLAALMANRFGRRGEGGFYAYPLPMGDKKRMYVLLLDAARVEAEAAKVVAEFPYLATAKGGPRLDALFTAMDRLVFPILSMEESLGADSAKLATSLKAMVKRLRLLSTSGDPVPITENGMKSTYNVFVAEDIYIEVAGADGTPVTRRLPKGADPFDGGAGATAAMLAALDDSRGRIPGETHSAKLQETGSALYKGNLVSGEAALRTEAILQSLGLGSINPLFAGLTKLAEESGAMMWTTPGAEKAYNKAEGFWPSVESRTEITLPDGSKATLVAGGRMVTHWTQATLEVANLVRQAAPSAKDTTVSVPYNVSQGFEEQRARAKTLFELNQLQAMIASGLYSVEDALAKATERAKTRDDYIGGMLSRGMSIRDPHALADVVPSLLSSAGAPFYTTAPTLTAQLVPAGEVLGEAGGWYQSPFLAPPGEKDGKTTSGLAMVNNVDARARYLWRVEEADLEAVKAAIVQLTRDPASSEAKSVLREKVRDYFGQEITGREAVDDLVLDDYSFDEDAVRAINGATYLAGTGGVGYRIPGGKDGMAAGFFRLSLPATLDYDANGRIVPGLENYAMISGRSAGQRGEDFDGDMFYFKIAQRETATLADLQAEYAAAVEAKDDKAVVEMEKKLSRTTNAEHVRALRGMTLEQATAVIDKTVFDLVLAADGRTVGEHASVGVTFDPKQPYLRGGRGLAAVGAKDDAQLKGVAVSAADAISMLSLYELLHKHSHEDLSTFFQRLNILQRALSNVVNIALDVVNEPRAAALHLTPKTLPLFVAFMVSQKIDPSVELDPAKRGDPKERGTVAWAAQRWLELADSVDMGAYEAFAEGLPKFEMDALLKDEAKFIVAMDKVAKRMLAVGQKIRETGQPIELSRWTKKTNPDNLKRIRGIAMLAQVLHRRGRISKAADRGFATIFDTMSMRKDLQTERTEGAGFEVIAPFLRAQAAVDTAVRTLRAALGDRTMDMILALDPKFRSPFDTEVNRLLAAQATEAVEAAYATGLGALGIAPEWRSRAAQAAMEKLISDPRMADSDFANSISAETGRKGQPRIKHTAPRTPPAIAQKAADEFFRRAASFGPVEIEVDGKQTSVPAEMVPALIALQQIEEHGVGPARFKGGVYHFLPASFQAEVAKQFEGEQEAAPVEAPIEPPPAETTTGPTYSEFLARLPKAVRKQMQRSLDAMGPDIAAMMGAERMSQDRIREELQIARNIADEMDSPEVGLLLGALETELLGETSEDGVMYPVSDLFEALGGGAGRLVTDHGLYGTEVLGDSVADGRRIANELVDATEMTAEEKSVVKTALARATPTGWETSATRQAILENGRGTLQSLYSNLTARPNDAGAATDLRDKVMARLGDNDASVRRDARAEVLRDIGTASKRNRGVQFSGVVSSVKTLVDQLAKADSILADTTTEAPVAQDAPAAPAPAGPVQPTIPGLPTSATRAAFDEMGLKPNEDFVTNGEIVGASEQNPIMATETLRYHRALEAEGLPVREYLDDAATAPVIAAFDGHQADARVAASISEFVRARDFRHAEAALDRSNLPADLKERVAGAIQAAKESLNEGHLNAEAIGYDPSSEPLDGRIDPIPDYDFDYRANETTSSTRTMDAIIRERLAFMIDYGGSQRAHQILKDTAYFVNAERKMLSNELQRERSIFFEDSRLTHFIRSIDSTDIDPNTGLHKKEYLRGVRNRLMKQNTRADLSIQDRNMLTRVFAAIDALIEGDEFVVYGGKIRKIDDPTTGETGKFAPQVATRTDQEGRPIGEIEPVAKILQDFAESSLYRTYLANGRTEADLDLEAVAARISGYYSGVRERLNRQSFAMLGREYLEQVMNYVPHQFGGRGFEDSFQREARQTASWQAENIGRRSGARAPLPPVAFDASRKSHKHPILPEQSKLVQQLASERDALLSEEADFPVRQAHRVVQRLAGQDMRGANQIILQLAREVEAMKAEKAARAESTYEMAKETADLIAGLAHASRNYAVKEWTERTEERVFKSYFEAYMMSEGQLVRRSTDPFTRLDRYVDDVTSAMSQQLITQIFSLAPVQTEEGFRPAVIGVPDLTRLSEMPTNRRVVSESVTAAQVAFIAQEANIKEVPGETPFHQLKWLIDNGFVKSSDYREVASPYGSNEKFLVLKGRPRQLLLKHLAVDPQALFRLVPGGAQHDAIKLANNIVQFTKHSAVSWSMFFVFAGVEATIALGGLSKHNIVAKAPSAWLQLRNLRRDIRRGDAALDDVIYKMHRAGIDMSEHAVSDGSTSIVERGSQRLSENLARWFGKPELAAQAKPAFDFLSGRWASKKIMGDFFPLVKFWGGLEIIEGMRREAPGVPLDTIYRKAAPNVNNAFGGQMFVDYPGLTPFWTKFLNLGMFALNWSISAWNIAGGQKLTGHRFGNYLSLEGERFVFMRNWPAMYFLVLLALPNVLQLGINAVARAAGGGDDEDELFASMNEAGKGGLFPSIDVTPIMRELPGYTGGRTGKRRVYIRFGKQSYEVINGWLNDPVKAFLRKTSMPVKLIWEQAFGSSPGSPEFSLPFKDMGFAGLFSSKADGNPFLKLWNSRAGFAAQKFLPLSWNTLVQGDMESWAFIGTAPMSKGMAQTRAIPPMAKLLETYAESDSFGRLRTDAAVRGNLERMTWSYLRALEKNGYDPDAVLVSAKGLVMRKYYQQFFDAMTREDQPAMDRAARSLIRLNGTARNLAASVAPRHKKKYKTPLTPDERAALMDSFEGLRVPFQDPPEAK